MSVIGPLKTLEELLSFDLPLLFVVEPLRHIERGEQGGPKNMLLHDTATYKEDKFVYGSNNVKSYNFPLWQAIDTFVYYTDNMVSIPPPGWITAAHKHGVKVLGTFTLKSEEGVKAINKIKGAHLVAKVASQLARVAALHRFDGWMVRIVTGMDCSAGHFVISLLAALTEEMHRAVAGSAVIWQESVQPGGKVEPQSELNDRNLRFFDSCDGIVLNSKWHEDSLIESAESAGKRRGDVYAGIDVLTRGTCHESRYEMHKAVAIARKYGLSAAISGAGWVYVEDRLVHLDPRLMRSTIHGTDFTLNFRQNQCQLWALPEKCRPQWRVTTLPLSTTFCQGFGTSLYKNGRELQPRYQGGKLCGGGGTAMLDTSVSFNGGGCLRLEYDPKLATKPNVVPYFRLFDFNLPLDSLCVSYTYTDKNRGSLAGHDMSLTLKVREAAGNIAELTLGSLIFVPQSGKYIVERDFTSSTQGDEGQEQRDWWTRKYLVKDVTGSANLEEIGVSFGANESLAFFIGELVVERAEVGSMASRDSPSNKDGADRPETEAGLREWLAKKDETGQDDPTQEAPIAFDVSMSSDEGD
ncbi:cytosolic endo-beta-N-acetylglucosaminidase isoform X2 [Rhipicephalus microplus]|uniref:cytosolic endo-beta-N-acetylglucosaminidase isoform X2 n=1 Tax=Rhipicephalus microplus TaxID=6941 RepID=UPI003F6CE246